MTNVHLIQILQVSIGPCVLISGGGLLLLSMSNRLSRPIDRIRLLCEHIKANPTVDQQALHEQIRILYKRCRLLRSAIVNIIACVGLVSLIILLLFLVALFEWPLLPIITGLFILSLVCLTISLIYFFLDVWLALESLKIEINDTEVIV